MNDIQYANLLSSRLERWVVKNNNPFLANFRCPICRDSQKRKHKKRGFLFQVSDGLMFKCHNCGSSWPFSKLLETIDPQAHKEYVMEKYKGTGKKPKVLMPMMPPKPAFKNPDRLIDRLMDRVDRLESGHQAVEYCEHRQIPREQWHRLYYVDNISNISQLSDKYRDRITTKEPRLVIPTFDANDKLVHMTCRAFSDDLIRYLTVNVAEPPHPPFGIDKFDRTKRGFVVEGPLDSLFVPNSVARGTSDLKGAIPWVIKENVTLIFDNQPRNREIVKLMQRHIDQGFTLMIWPDGTGQKDINNIIMEGEMTANQLMTVINNNTFNGLALQVKFNKWKKIGDGIS